MPHRHLLPYFIAAAALVLNGALAAAETIKLSDSGAALGTKRPAVERFIAFVHPSAGQNIPVNNGQWIP